jgi:hypothetical protein
LFEGAFAEATCSAARATRPADSPGHTETRTGDVASASRAHHASATQPQLPRCGSPLHGATCCLASPHPLTARALRWRCSLE